ncbi:MAG: hypothetical protein ACPHLK_03500 [Gammaproteobacteria bacterium]
MRDELIGFFATIAAIVIFLSLNHFYKKKFEKNLIEGKQKVVGAAIVIISIIAAFVLMF